MKVLLHIYVIGVIIIEYFQIPSILFAYNWYLQLEDSSLLIAYNLFDRAIWSSFFCQLIYDEM